MTTTEPNKWCINCEMAFMEYQPISHAYECSFCQHVEPVPLKGMESNSDPLPLDETTILYCPHFTLHRSQGEWVCSNCGVRHPDSGWVVYFSTVAESQAKAIETLQKDLKAARKAQKTLEYLEEHAKRFPMVSTHVALLVSRDYTESEMGT